MVTLISLLAVGYRSVRILAFMTLLFGPVLGHGARAGGQDGLKSVEQLVRDAYPDVAHIEPSRFVELAAQPGSPIVVFDVRDVQEWQVSRVAGARQVAPGVWRQEFLASHGLTVKGKTVVFYCSVGVRSSKLAGRVQAALKQAGAVAVYNLSGGAFRWHNERRSLVTDSGETPFIHPYDRHWGRYLADQSSIRWKPDAASLTSTPVATTAAGTGSSQ